jgi:alpha-1,2-mannosyltransferase
VARRWRAAALATVVALGATALAASADPDASRFYWTEALWDTSRVGRLGYVSNQSVQGILARLGEPDRAVWAAAVLLVLGVWALRARRAVASGDWAAAFALTGLAACLVSPITWVHHLVWLLPSFAVLIRTGHVRIAGGLYAVLCTSVVWLWFDDASGVDGFLGSNTYAWITLGLLLWLPAGQQPPDRRTGSRSTSTTTDAPSPAAPAISPASVHPEPASSSGTAAATAGGVFAAGGAAALDTSSEPTGSTRLPALNPQSSSERASSYTADPPPS